MKHSDLNSNLKNLISAQLYQLRFEKTIQREWLACMIFQMMTIFMFSLQAQTDITGCQFFAESLNLMILLPVTFVFLLTGQLCAGDFMDKTQNYEILNGNRRSEIYLSRTILSILLGMCLSLLLLTFPVIVAGILYGWGEQMPVSDAVIRMVLMMFPLFRMICEAVFLAFISRHVHLPTAVGGLVAYLNVMGVIRAKTPLTGISNMNLLCAIEKYNIFDPHEVMYSSYDAMLSGSDIAGTVLFSLCGGLLALFLGYYFFARDDIH